MAGTLVKFSKVLARTALSQPQALAPASSNVLQRRQCKYTAIFTALNGVLLAIAGFELGCKATDATCHCMDQHDAVHETLNVTLNVA